MDIKELEVRFNYHPPTPGQIEKYGELRNRFLELAKHLTETCPESRELSSVITHLEQTLMWANAAIARRSK